MLTYLIIAFCSATITGIVVREKRRKKIKNKWGKYIEELERDKENKSED